MNDKKKYIGLMAVVWLLVAPFVFGVFGAIAGYLVELFALYILETDYQMYLSTLFATGFGFFGVWIGVPRFYRCLKSANKKH